MPMLKLIGEATAGSRAAIEVSDGAVSSRRLAEQMRQRLLVGALVVEVPLRHRRLVGLVGDDHVQHVAADIAAGLPRHAPASARGTSAALVGLFTPSPRAKLKSQYCAANSMPAVALAGRHQLDRRLPAAG